MKIQTLALFILVPLLPLRAAIPTEDLIKSIDREWEEIQLNIDIEGLQSFLHPDFVWIHNHANMIEEGKDSILARFERKVKRIRKRNPNLEISNVLKIGPEKGSARKQRNTKVIVSEECAVIYGYTDKYLSDYAMRSKPQDERKVVYHFMRTYVVQDGKWLLIGNHTMEVPQKETK